MFAALQRAGPRRSTLPARAPNQSWTPSGSACEMWGSTPGDSTRPVRTAHLKSMLRARPLPRVSRGGAGSLSLGTGGGEGELEARAAGAGVDAARGPELLRRATGCTVDAGGLLAGAEAGSGVGVTGAAAAAAAA